MEIQENYSSGSGDPVARFAAQHKVAQMDKIKTQILPKDGSSRNMPMPASNQSKRMNTDVGLRPGTLGLAKGPAVITESDSPITVSQFEAEEVITEPYSPFTDPFTGKKVAGQGSSLPGFS